MAQQEVKVFFKVDGLDGYITDLNQLQDALSDVNKDTEELNDQVETLGKSKGKTGGFFSAIKGKGVGAFRALKGAIAATGIGLLLTGLAQLVSWFKESDTGAKILQGTTAALGAIFGQLQKIFFDIVDLIKPLFEDPVQSIKDFGQAIVDNLVNRFMGILELIPNLARAVGELFKGNFSEAGTIAANAVGKVLIGVEDTVGTVSTAIDVVSDFGEQAVQVFNETATAVVAAVEASNNLIDAQNDLRKLNQDLLVENALLNQELETQQKIADDTTRSYEERKVALDRVNAANEKKAANAIILAQQEKEAIELGLAIATTDEERKELKDQLAEATATLIDAETQAELVRLDSAQLNRELDQEEFDRLEEIRLKKEEIAAKEAEDAEKRREDKKKGDEKAAADAITLAENEAKQRQKIADTAFNVIGDLTTLFSKNDEKNAEKTFKRNKKIGIAQAVINTGLAVTTALTGGGNLLKAATGAQFVEAGIAAVAGAAQIAVISRQQFQGTGGEGPPPPPSIPNTPAGALNFGPDNAGIEQQDANIDAIGQGGNGLPVRTYVLAGDVTSAQEADAEIQNLATL